MRNARLKMQKLTARPFRAFAFFILHFALLASVTACGAKAKAASLPDGPPLAIPHPPAHEIAVEQVAEAPQPQPPAPEPEPLPSRPATTVTTKPKPEPKETPAAAVQPTPPPPAPIEAPAVRATVSPADERRVGELLSRAASDLKRVNYQRLSTEGKSQYDQSKRFSDQAQQAIKERNVVYALTLAEKAADIAAELVR